jgi:hypothetical protein
VRLGAAQCASQETNCPAAYATCPAGLTLAPPIRQKVCSHEELMNAAAGCAGAQYTVACNSFFDFEEVSNPGCFNCISPFRFDFSEQTGIRTCVAPYLDDACNHNSACILDCLAESCYACATEPCEALARSGPCSTFNQADQCVTQALNGPAAVCNPATYQGDLGAWLQAVGAAYCGQ